MSDNMTTDEKLEYLESEIGFLHGEIMRLERMIEE